MKLTPAKSIFEQTIDPKVKTPTDEIKADIQNLIDDFVDSDSKRKDMVSVFLRMINTKDVEAKKLVRKVFRYLSNSMSDFALEKRIKKESRNEIDALDTYAEYLGWEELCTAIVLAESTDETRENLNYISQNYDLPFKVNRRGKLEFE